MSIYICAILRNESKYLDEWLKYHLNLGIDGIILYDNNIDAQEKQKTKQIVNSYPIVIICDWNEYDDVYHIFGLRITGIDTLNKLGWHFGKNKQQLAYDDALKICKQKNIKWLIKIDIDEFLVFTDENMLKKKNGLKTIFSNYNNYKGVAFKRYNFGSSNHKTKPNNYVTQSYIYREKIPSSYKEACQVKHTTDSGYSSHSWIYSPNYIVYFLLFLILIIFTTRINKKIAYITILLIVVFFIIINVLILSGIISLVPTSNDIVIYHYIYKSKEEYLQRKKYNCTRSLEAKQQDLLDRYHKYNKIYSEYKDVQCLRQSKYLLQH